MYFSTAAIASAFAATVFGAAVPTSAPNGYWDVSFAQRTAHGAFYEQVIEGNYFSGSDNTSAAIPVRCLRSAYAGQIHPNVDCTPGFSWDHDLYWVEGLLSLQQVLADKTVNGTTVLPKLPLVRLGATATVHVQVPVDQAIA